MSESEYSNQYQNLDDYQYHPSNQSIPQNKKKKKMNVKVQPIKRSKPGGKQQQKQQAKPKHKKRSTKTQNPYDQIKKEKQIKLIFQNICNQNGQITGQSVNKALFIKNKQFNPKLLKKMLLFFEQACGKQRLNQIRLQSNDVSHSNRQQSEEIDFQTFRFSFQDFKKLYENVNNFNKSDKQ